MYIYNFFFPFHTAIFKIRLQNAEIQNLLIVRSFNLITSIYITFAFFLHEYSNRTLRRIYLLNTNAGANFARSKYSLLLFRNY